MQTTLYGYLERTTFQWPFYERLSQGSRGGGVAVTARGSALSVVSSALRFLCYTYFFETPLKSNNNTAQILYSIVIDLIG